MLTRISFILRKNRPLDRAAAWNSFWLNLLVMPGMGSLLFGRWEGIPQVLMGIFGFLAFNIWLVQYLYTCALAMELLWDAGPHGWMLKWGFAAFAISWAWGLMTSWTLIRKFRE